LKVTFFWQVFLLIFFLCVFYFFVFFVFFVCLGGFPLNMVVCGRRLLGPFLDVFQKPIKI